MIGLSKVLPDLIAAPMAAAARIAGEGYMPQREEALAEGRRLAEEGHAIEVARLVTGHRAELKREREEWCSDEGAEIARALKQQVADAGDEIANAVVQVLETVITVELPKTALKSMQAEIRAAFRADIAREIKLKGPPDLTAELASALKSEGIDVASMADSLQALEATAPDFVIVTMLERWLEELRRG
jgi:hypothetical protein